MLPLYNFYICFSDATDRMIYSYTRSINGFAARLTDEEKDKLLGKEGVVSVFPSGRTDSRPRGHGTSSASPRRRAGAYPRRRRSSSA
jgi:hypothetical protein